MQFGFAISPRPTRFGPMLFAGRLDEGLRVAGELRLDAVELSLRSPSDVSRDALRRTLDERHLRLSALATGQACLFDSLCLSSTDESVRARTVALLQAEIELAADFGAAVIVGGIRGRLTGTPPEQEDQRAAAIRSMAECAKTARRLGVTLLLEPINRYETNFVNTAAEGLALLEVVGEPSFKLLLDTFHMNIEESSLAASIRQVGDRLGYLHIADSNRHAPGQGHTDLVSVLELLQSLGYAGYVSAEILPLPEDLTAARDTGRFVEQWRVRMCKREQEK